VSFVDANGVDDVRMFTNEGSARAYFNKMKDRRIKRPNEVRKLRMEFEASNGDWKPVADEHEGFAKLERSLAHRKGVSNPDALAAAIGRKKYGAKGMAAKAAAGRAKDYKGQENGYAPITGDKIVGAGIISSIMNGIAKCDYGNVPINKLVPMKTAGIWAIRPQEKVPWAKDSLKPIPVAVEWSKMPAGGWRLYRDGSVVAELRPNNGGFSASTRGEPTSAWFKPENLEKAKEWAEFWASKIGRSKDALLAPVEVAA